MGISIVFSILAPAMALVMPDQGNSDTSPPMARAMAASERDPTPSQPVPEDPHASHPTNSTAKATSTSAQTSSSDDDVPATNAIDHSDHPDHSNRPDDKAKTEAEEASTTTVTSRPETTATSASAEESGGVLTGAVCPCTIGGTAELKGEVSLKGDLIVDGGILVARPGVNLIGNGFQIMFMNGGRADFQGTQVATWSGDGSNANFNRDTNFRDLRRMMFHSGAGKSILRYFTVADSGTSTVGDYPIHFHLNGNSTRGTLVEGVVVVNGRHHAFVPHGSDGITFKDTIAVNTRCEAYWWDPPEFQSNDQTNNSHDILYDHALADGVTNCPGDNRGFRLSAFELGAGTGNTIRNSVARNVNPTHAKDCSGFNWPELSDKQPSSWTFTNNASFGSKCNGIFVWQNDNERHVISGFSGDGIDHGAYLNKYDYRNVDVKFIEVHALGWSVTGGRAPLVTAFRHSLNGEPVTFSDVRIDRLVVDNANDGGTVPGTYIFDRTGLTCSDVIYRSSVPGTSVLIDGTEC